MFGLFGKKERSVRDMLLELTVGQQVFGRLEKVTSLRKLGRSAEADQLVAETRKLVDGFVSSAHSRVDALLLKAVFCVETGDFKGYDQTYLALTSDKSLSLSKEQRLALDAQHVGLARQRAPEERAKAPARTAAGSMTGFTTVYVCQSCGKLINFVSLPCSYCGYAAPDAQNLLAATFLSNQMFSMVDLVKISRDIANGVPFSKLGQSLLEKAKNDMASSETRSQIQVLFGKLHEVKTAGRRRLIEDIPKCSNCQSPVPMSIEDDCPQCQKPLRWPPAVKFIANLRSCLFFVETWIDPSNVEAFSEWVCLLVFFIQNMTYKQTEPTAEHRKYALKVLGNLQMVFGDDRGACVDFRKLDDMQVHAFKDKMKESTTAMASLFYMELQAFIAAMRSPPRY